MDTHKSNQFKYPEGLVKSIYSLFSGKPTTFMHYADDTQMVQGMIITAALGNGVETTTTSEDVKVSSGA